MFFLHCSLLNGESSAPESRGRDHARCGEEEGGDRDEAVRLLERAVAIDPGHYSILGAARDLLHVEEMQEERRLAREGVELGVGDAGSGEELKSQLLGSHEPSHHSGATLACSWSAASSAASYSKLAARSDSAASRKLSRRGPHAV